MRLKVKLTVVVLAALVLTSISTPVMGQDPLPSTTMLYGTVSADFNFEIANDMTSTGSTAMIGDNGKTFWYDVDDFTFDLDMLLELLVYNDSGEGAAMAASTVHTMNKLMMMETPVVSDYVIINGDLVGSQIFIKLLREVGLDNANAYEFIPGFVFGQDISFAMNMTTVNNQVDIPVDFPAELTNFTIPGGLPIAYTGLTNPHAFNNLTLWSMVENMDSKGDDFMSRIFGPIFSPVLMNTTEGWTQNAQFYEDMFTNMEIGEGMTFAYDVDYTAGVGLEIEANVTYEEGDLGIEQRADFIWSEANGGWIDYIMVEFIPYELTPVMGAEIGDGPLLRIEFSHASTEAALPIGVQTGDTGTTGTGNVNLDLELTDQFADLLPPELTIADIENEVNQLANIQLLGYEIGEFDGMYYGLTITDFYNFGDTGTGAQEGEVPDNLVVNAWNGMIYLNETAFITDYSWEDHEIMMEVYNDVGTINLPVNMSDTQQYDWSWWDNWDNITGVFLSNEYDYWYTPNDPAQPAANLWNDETDTFDGVTLTLNSLTDWDNAPYRVVIEYEAKEQYYPYYTYDSSCDWINLPVLLHVENNVGKVKLPKFAPDYGVEIYGVFMHNEYDWWMDPEEYAMQYATNYWNSSCTFDGQNLTLVTDLADELYEIVIIAGHKPLNGKGIYISLFETMGMMDSGNDALGAQDDSGPSADEFMGILAALGLFSPAVSPEWWYHGGMTTAMNSMMTDMSTKYNSLFNIMWDEMSADPSFPSDRFVEDPTMVMDMSAAWDDGATRRDMTMSMDMHAAVEGSLLDTEWPFKSDTNITAAMSMDMYEDWTAAGIVENKGMSVSLFLDILDVEPETTTTTTSTDSESSTTTSEVPIDFTPGFELVSLLVLVLAVPVITRKRR